MGIRKPHVTNTGLKSTGYTIVRMTSVRSHTSETIYSEVRKLFSEYRIKKEIRLIKVGAANFAAHAGPMDLFGYNLVEKRRGLG